ncbi:MAG: hypothetical protein GY862_22950, partial [Gammaproteobacteria bacterium]|nr:hypothetical protein [Gammaproteobacteria bacterium]
MDNQKEKLLEIYLAEYTKLKEEQLRRITFRDVNIPLSTFLVIASTLSAMFRSSTQDNADGYYLLLLIPLISITLGWSFIANDEKISTIGDYLEKKLKKNIMESGGFSVYGATSLFGWEAYHKDEDHKEGRKWSQFVVNIITFVCSGIAAIVMFLYLTWNKVPPDVLPYVYTLIVIEGVFLLGLVYWIYIYSAPKSLKEHLKEF